jgi:hypothetical protein
MIINMAMRSTPRGDIVLKKFVRRGALDKLEHRYTIN